MSFTITVPGPLGENLGQNARGHWSKKSRPTKDAREEWQMAASSVLIAMGHQGSQRVRLTVHAYFCRRKPRSGPDVLISRQGYRPTDKDNLQSAMKPALDGIIDAGLVADDASRYLDLGPPEITWVDTFEEERVEVLVEELE